MTTLLINAEHMNIAKQFGQQAVDQVSWGIPFYFLLCVKVWSFQRKTFMTVALDAQKDG